MACSLMIACAGGRTESEAQQSAAVSIVTILPGSATLSVGDTVQMEAVLIGPNGDTVHTAPVEWRSANTAIATITAGGQVHAVGPGLAGITAVSGGRTGTARIVVAPAGAPRPRVVAQQPIAVPPATRPTPGSGSAPRAAAPASRIPTSEAAARRSGSEAAHPHEPPGFHTLADRAFGSKAARDNDRGDRSCRGGSECWDGVEHRYRNFEIVRDPTAPFSCCTIARMRYPAGHRSGTAPATVQTRSFRPPVEELYVSIRARLSSNWFGNQSNTNKMFFLGLGKSGNNIFLSAEGSGDGVLQPQIRLQGVPDERARIRPNRRQVFLRRGEWQHWEFYFKLNDPGGANGIARLWIDGELVTEAADVRFRGPADPTRRWWIFHWSPTYGGGGAPVPAEQYLDFDHVYVSGR